MRARVTSISFGPSSYLDAAELSAIEAAWTGRTLGLAELGGLSGAVDALYRQKGIAFAHAVVDAAAFASGSVRVDLVEARLGEVRYESASLSPAYLDFRLGLKTGDLADNRLIHSRLERLSLTDGVLMSADFQPNADGSIDLVITPAGQKAVSGYLSVDNFGKESTGRQRLSTGMTVHNLTGWNDMVSVSGAVTRGARSVTLSYSRVVHPLGTRLTAFAEGARSTTLAAPVVNNRSFSVELGLNHPFVMRPDFRVTGSATVLGFAEQGDILGIPLVDQDGYGVRLGSSQFINGDGWFLSTGQTLTALWWDNDGAGETGLETVNLQANLATALRLDDNHIFSLQVAGQIGFDANTPSKYSFGVAGPAGVRGYDQDVSSSDTGFYARAQIERSTPLPLGLDGLDIRPFVFADIGRSYEFSGGGYLPFDLLAGAGAGMSFTLGGHLSGDVYVAKPLLDANGFSASRNYEIGFGLTASF